MTPRDKLKPCPFCGSESQMLFGPPALGAIKVDEEALDKAAREGYATRCKTNGPRVLAEYAAPDIMAMQLANTRVVVEAYLAALSVKERRYNG